MLGEAGGGYWATSKLSWELIVSKTHGNEAKSAQDEVEIPTAGGGLFVGTSGC